MEITISGKCPSCSHGFEWHVQSDKQPGEHNLIQSLTKVSNQSQLSRDIQAIMEDAPQGTLKAMGDFIPHWELKAEESLNRYFEKLETKIQNANPAALKKIRQHILISKLAIPKNILKELEKKKKRALKMIKEKEGSA